MAEVADHLVPQDGLTTTSIEFIRLDAEGKHDNEVDIVFGLYDKDGYKFAEFPIEVQARRTGAPTRGNIDALVAEGHRQMTNVLRQWLYEIDTMRRAYESGPD